MSKSTKRSVIEKLLKVCETFEASIIEKYARTDFGDFFQELTADNALVNFKTLKVVSVPDGDDEFVAEIERRDGKNGYFSSADGWVAVPDEDLTLYKVNFDWLLQAIMTALAIADRHKPKVVLEEHIWALGQHRIETRNTHIIVARGLRNSTVIQELKTHLDKHHQAKNPGLVITLDPLIPEHLSLPNQNKLVKLTDAIKWDKDKFEINTVLLAGSMRGNRNQEGFSSGFRSLSVNGDQYTFTPKQADAIEFLFNAGGATRHQDEILAEINSSQRKLLHVFRSRGEAHKAWGVIIKYDGKGNYWLEV
jgi:hypothetical protein